MYFRGEKETTLYPPILSTIQPSLSHLERQRERVVVAVTLMGLSSLSLSILLVHLSLLTTTATCKPISPGSTLHASDLNQAWSSPNNNFSFSFLPTTNGFIAAISYNGIPIWQAGGATTFVDSGASFQFLSSGNLCLVNGSGTTIWESNTTGLGVSSASLDDSGNFVLKNATVSIWSTFGNPTDTIVPSQNFTIGKVLRNGLYSFSLVRSGNLTLRWNNSIEYWTLGLNSSFIENLTLPSLGLQSIGILSISDSMLSSPVIMAYSSDYAEGSNIFRFLKLDSDGNLRIYGSVRGSGTSIIRWSAVPDQCKVFGYCGDMGICSYNYSSPICNCPSKNFDPIDSNDSRKGCKRKIEIGDCQGSESMLQLNHALFLTYPPETDSQIYTAAIEACRSTCLNNGACVASTSLSDGHGRVYYKTPGFLSGYQSPALPSTSYIKICGPGLPNSYPSGSLREDQDWKSRLCIVALVVVGTILGLILLQGGLWWRYCRNSLKFGKFSAHYALGEYASGAPVQFSYKELQRSTKRFKEKLGAGGFGAVYRGILANKTVVAVKQLERIGQGEKQFRMEVVTISSTHHLNLVRLIGFCSEGRHRILVYEFMKHGSLDNFLFTIEEQSGKLLNWQNRFNIALGTARGINYLHEECRDCIMHCDIKPENILLDENYNARVSDFGLEKLKNPRDHHYQTLTSLGGYLPPEWLANLPITSKFDVYSFGMVLLEIVSGRRNFEVSEETNGKKFSVWAYEELKKGNVAEIIDKRLANHEVDMEQVMRTIQVSFWCIQEQPSRRPKMGKVVHMLEGITDIEMPPAPMALTDGSVSGTNINKSRGFSAVSTFAASAPAPSSSLSLQNAVLSLSVLGRKVERESSSLQQSQS